MIRLRRATPLALVALALLATGCPDKKTDAPPEPPRPATPPPEAKPPPPPPAAVERAVVECAAPIELAPPADVKVGDRTARSTGYKLTFSDADKDGTITFGVLGPINEDSGANILVLKKYVKFFQDEKADAIIVTGDVGEIADGIKRVLDVVAASNLPVLVIAGNRECRAEYTDGVNAAKAQHPNIINLNQFRAVEFPEVTVVSLPGYHDPNYINCATGCRYFKSTVDEVIKVAREAKNPVLMVAHGPPHGESSQSLDYASGGGNVGDSEVNRAIAEGNIKFGAFSNIKEAGARGTSDAAGTTQLKPGAWSPTVFVNPGPADTVGWEMNDGTKSIGLAATLSVNKEGQGSWKLFRAKPLSAAEKAEAKKLEPPARPETTPEEEKKETAPTPPAPPPPGGGTGTTPTPPPGKPAGTP